VSATSWPAGTQMYDDGNVLVTKYLYYRVRTAYGCVIALSTGSSQGILILAYVQYLTTIPITCHVYPNTLSIWASCHAGFSLVDSHDEVFADLLNSSWRDSALIHDVSLD